MNEIKGYFKPEFINRVDDIVVFHGLNQEQIVQIGKVQLAKLTARLQKMDISLQVSDDALSHIAEVGFDPVYGARPLKRAIQQEIENPLAKEILSGKYLPGQTIMVELKKVYLLLLETVVDCRSKVW